MLKIDDEYMIYSKRNSGPYKFVCNISTYADFDISLWDYGRPVINIYFNNLQGARYDSQFVWLAADFFDGRELPGTDCKVRSWKQPSSCKTFFTIDYSPTIELRNFWKIGDIREDVKYVINALRDLFRIFEAGRCSKMKEDTEKENKDMYSSIIESMRRYSFNPKSVADNSVIKVTIGTIEKVIYNYPATIIFWKDNTKTVVKCQGEDSYDPQKGFMLCVLKKLLGNRRNYYDCIKTWCPEDIFENMSIRDTDGVKFTQTTITEDFVRSTVKEGI